MRAGTEKRMHIPTNDSVLATRTQDYCNIWWQYNENIKCRVELLKVMKSIMSKVRYWRMTDGWVRYCALYASMIKLPWTSPINMMTSSNGNIFRFTGPLCGEFTGDRGFPRTKPVARSFDVFFDLRRINGWVNNRVAGDLRRHLAYYEVIIKQVLCIICKHDHITMDISLKTHIIFSRN